MDRKDLYRALKFLALAGNILLVLWVTYNGIDEGFRGTVYQKISYVGLILLMALNSALLFAK